MDSNSNEKLTEAQQDRIRKGKERALMIRQSRLTVHPYYNRETVSIDKTTIKIGTTKYRDTGGGFLLEEAPDKERAVVTVEEEPPILESDRPTCEHCKECFAKSWLFDKFDAKICDNCKDPEEAHKLITKTEAINLYLLKDCDFDKRDPPLRFVSKKNPHNVHWGEMKLYLESQVEKRALEVWGSKEKIEEELELREEKRILNKTKKYQKKMKELRMTVRSSLYDRTSSAAHTHEFDNEKYNSDEDTYTHKCKICAYEETFEKM